MPTEGQERCTCGTGAKNEAEWLEPRQPDSECPVHGQERRQCPTCGGHRPDEISFIGPMSGDRLYAPWKPSGTDHCPDPFHKTAPDSKREER